MARVIPATNGSRRPWNRVILTIAVGAFSLAAGVCSLTALVHKPSTVIARSWANLEYQTLVSERPEYRVPWLSADPRAAGGIWGQRALRYLNASFGGGGAELSISNARIFVLHLPGARPELRYDAESNMLFWRLIVEGKPVDYTTPFEVMPDTLEDRVIYASATPELVHLRAGGQWVHPNHPPDIRLLVGEPADFAVAQRGGCAEAISLRYSPTTKARNVLSMDEDCWQRGYRYANPPSVERNGRSAFHLDVPYGPGGYGSLVILPEGFTVHTPGYELLDTSGVEHLILVRTRSNFPELNMAGLSGRSESPMVRLTAVLGGPAGVPEGPVAHIRAPTTSVRLSDALGRVTTGTRTIPTDDLSVVEIGYEDLPDFTIGNRVTLLPEGTPRLSEFVLKGEGAATTIRVNGEEQLRTPWSSLPEGTAAAIVGGCIGAVATLMMGLRGPGQRNFDPPTTEVALPTHPKKQANDPRQDKYNVRLEELDLKKREYGLKLGEQANKLLELQQSVMLFMVAGSIASITFSLTFSLNNRAMVLAEPNQFRLLGIACLFGLMSGLSGLLAMLLTLESYRYNMRYLHKGKTYDELTVHEQRPWDAVTNWSRRLRWAAIVFLCLSIGTQAVLIGVSVLRGVIVS